MEWSFRLLMLFAITFAVLAADHYLLSEALTSTLAGAVSAVGSAF